MKPNFESVTVQGTPMHRIGDAFYEPHEWGMWAIQSYNQRWKAWERWDDSNYSTRKRAEAEKARLDIECFEGQFRVIYTGAVETKTKEPPALV
jgi:hypothetical protein